MKGLVLEGGAMRGMYTAGVLDVFMDNGIEFDKVVGVSAGALFGVNLLSKQKGRVIRYNKRFNKDHNYIGIRPLFHEGNIISTHLAYDVVPRELDPFDDETFQRSASEFYAVVTNVDTGLPEYKRIYSGFAQMDTLRASGSMPFVSTPVEIDGQKYLDGGISDSIPFHWMASQGCDKLVVVLTRDITYRKTPASKRVGIYSHVHPKIADQLKTRHERYNNTVAFLREWEEAGKAFVIRPSAPIVMDTMERDPDKLQAVYDLGSKDAAAALDSLKAYLQQ